MATQKKTRTFWQRVSSRKFILALSGAVTGIVVALFPEHEGETTQIVGQVTGAVITIGSILGYVHGESKIDAERERKA